MGCSTTRCATLTLVALLAGGIVSFANSSATAADTAVTLPEQVAAWRLAGPSLRVLPENIFDYMDGAGELYLGYRFRYLDVAEYASPNAGSILVEMYSMEASDDAYGLLSTDWGGEPVELDNATADRARGRWPPRALYGEGLLRVWAGDLYARIMADRATPEARAAIVALGRAVTAGRGNAVPPRLLAALPRLDDRGFVVRPAGVCFLRSYLVLNSTYFLSSRDILSLDRHVDAVLARFSPSAQGGAGTVVLLLVRYPDPVAATNGLVSFRTAYLPESVAGAEAQVAKVEDGWTASARLGRDVAFVFGCGNQAEARLFLDRALVSLKEWEAAHE